MMFIFLMSEHCPNCDRYFPSTEESIIINFGRRLYRGIKYRQSWCRRCRKEEREEKRLLR